MAEELKQAEEWMFRWRRGHSRRRRRRRRRERRRGGEGDTGSANHKTVYGYAGNIRKAFDVRVILRKWLKSYICIIRMFY